MKACYGTTKYCNAFLKGLPCNNVECLYLHDVGELRLHASHTLGALSVSKSAQTVKSMGIPQMLQQAAVLYIMLESLHIVPRPSGCLGPLDLQLRHTRWIQAVACRPLSEDLSLQHHETCAMTVQPRMRTATPRKRQRLRAL